MKTLSKIIISFFLFLGVLGVSTAYGNQPSYNPSPTAPLENDKSEDAQPENDEEDFQDVNEDKYVDLNKSVKMLCQFSVKFKRWIPLKIHNDRVVHIHTLTKNFNI